MLLTITSERQGRIIDKDHGASMEMKTGLFLDWYVMKLKSNKTNIIANDIDAFLKTHQNKSFYDL